MVGYIDEIREISEDILKSGKVDMVIGFRKGTIPMMNKPCFIKDLENIKNLVWGRHMYRFHSLYKRKSPLPKKELHKVLVWFYS